MAEITRYVNTASTAGGDGTSNGTTGSNRAYASLDEASDAEAADLVTAGDNLVILCSGSTADSTFASFDQAAWNTSTTNDVLIKPNVGQEHSGVWNTGVYRLTSGLATSTLEDLTLERLQVTENATLSNAHVLRYNATLTGGVQVVRDCLIKMDHSDAEQAGQGIHMQDSSPTYYISNNIVYVADSSSHTAVRNGINMAGAGGTYYVYNNTIAGAWTIGIRTNGTDHVRNNIIDGATTCIDGTPNTEQYNAASDATVSGTGSRTNQTFTYGSGPDNYLITSSDAGAKGFGEDLSGDANLPITDDIVGTSRPQDINYDIGAFEVPEGSTSPALVGTVAQSTTTSVAHTLAAGRGNRIVFGLYGSEDPSGIDPTPTGVTYGGQAMTLLGSHKNTGHNTCVYSFYILEADLPANGANTFDASSISNNANDACTVLCLDNLAQTTESDVLIGDLGSGDTAGGDITVATNNDLVLFQSHTRTGETFSSTTMDVAAFLDIGGGDATQMYGYALTPVAGEFAATVTSTTVIANPATIISSWAQLSGSAGSGTLTILQQHG